MWSLAGQRCCSRFVQDVVFLCPGNGLRPIRERQRTRGIKFVTSVKMQITLLQLSDIHLSEGKDWIADKVDRIVGAASAEETTASAYILMRGWETPNPPKHLNTSFSLNSVPVRLDHLRSCVLRFLIFVRQMKMASPINAPIPKTIHSLSANSVG